MMVVVAVVVVVLPLWGELVGFVDRVCIMVVVLEGSVDGMPDIHV